MATPNMNLSLPTVSTTPGPQWASSINTAFGTVDSHNHTSGNGVQIPAAGLNINGDLTFNSNNATTLRSVRFSSQPSILSLGTDLSCLYAVSGNLYWNSGAGAPVQLTVGGALNATSIGGIGGDYATSSASLFYTSAINTFTFWRSSNINANLDASQIKIRFPSSGAYYVGLNASASMSNDINVTLPTSLPGSQKFMTLDPSGNIASPWAVDGSTIEVALGTTVQVKDSGITLAKLAATVINNLVPAGTIMSYAGNSAPSSYLLCDGTSYATSSYADLFAVIGYRYGGSGSNFNVPDLRYNFLRGSGNEQVATGSGTVVANDATFTAHGFTTGTLVRLTDGALSGLTLLTDYYVIVINANTLAFATTYANALSGTKVSITGANSAVITKYTVWANGTGTATSNNATFTNHGINRTGMRVRMAAGSLSGLGVGSIYFAIVIDSNTLAFATTYANAIASSPVKIAISGTNTAAIQQWEDPDISSRYRSSINGPSTGPGTRQDDAISSHNHTIFSYTANNFHGNVSTNVSGGGPGQGQGTVTVDATGGNQTTPRNVYVNYIIKF